MFILSTTMCIFAGGFIGKISLFFSCIILLFSLISLGYSIVRTFHFFACFRAFSLSWWKLNFTTIGFLWLSLQKFVIIAAQSFSCDSGKLENIRFPRILRDLRSSISDLIFHLLALFSSFLLVF